jgi:hypothetical protein
MVERDTPKELLVSHPNQCGIRDTVTVEVSPGEDKVAVTSKATL